MPKNAPRPRAAKKQDPGEEAARYRVVRSFRHEEQYITNDNVHTLPEDALKDRIERGYVEDLAADRVATTPAEE